MSEEVVADPIQCGHEMVRRSERSARPTEQHASPPSPVIYVCGDPSVVLVSPNLASTRKVWLRPHFFSPRGVHISRRELYTTSRTGLRSLHLCSLGRLEVQDGKPGGGEEV